MSNDLTAQAAQAEAEIAFALQTRIKEAMADGRDALWRLAEALYEFDEAHGWLKLNYENLSQWLADADVTISRATYYRYVKTWRKLVVEKHIDPERIRLLDQSKVAIVTDKIASSEVLVEEALSDVEALGAQDLREKYYGPKAEPSNVGQEPEPDENLATTPQDDSGHLPDMDEPIRADDIVVDSTAEEVKPDEEKEEDELPPWVTESAVRSLLTDLSSALDSGASFPRIGRRSCQVAEQLAQAWTNRN
jgi:hypothetical protein